MSEAIAKLDAYFSHANRDHVSRDDLAAAKGELGADADALIDGLTFSDDGYNALRDCVREGAFGASNDKLVSLADLHKAASGKAPQTIYRRLAAAQRLSERAGPSAEVVRRYRDIPNRVGSSGLGYVDNAGQTQALLAMSSPDVVQRYNDLKNVNLGTVENANVVRFMLARGGPAAVQRYRELDAHRAEFGWVDAAALTQALIACGPADAYDRYKALGRSGVSFGWVDKAAVVRAMLAVAPPEATERFRALRPASEFGWVEEEGLTRAIIATGPADALDRYRSLEKSGLSFGWVDNAGVTRALLAVSDAPTVDRYRALGETRMGFGWVNQAGVVQAELARGEIYAPLPAVPAAIDDDN